MVEAEEEGMDNISEKDFEVAEEKPVPNPLNTAIMSEEDLKALASDMQHPVERMKELAAKLKIFIDHQINRETIERGMLTDMTRRWITEYNSLLEKIQKSIYGDKSVSINLHKIGHADVGAAIRKYSGSKVSVPIKKEIIEEVTSEGTVKVTFDKEKGVMEVEA
jgi:DNA-directed RNA polymerase subunit L